MKRIPGTTNVQIFGAKDYAMRIWLKPDRMAQLKLTAQDIAQAISEQNAQFAAGKVGQAPNPSGQELVYTITTEGRLSSVQEFENILIRVNPDGSSLRLSDVARVELGSKDYNFQGRVNGKPATLMGIFLQSGANALEVADNVQQVLAELEPRFPEGLTYAVPYDTTPFVKVSIREVIKTLIEAMILVFLVVYLFLQNFKATLIPSIAVPVSLLGTFAGLYVLGYSINMLTLFGMVLSIGIVVDDAILVLENVERNMREEGLKARDAAIQAMKEVTGPVVASVLVLAAAFIPIAFLGGLTGELYRQFSITISIAVIISGIVALTLTPTLCMLMLKDGHRKSGRFFTWFNDWFARVTRGYVSGVKFMTLRPVLGIALFGLMLLLTAGLFKITPGSLVPPEDQGYYIGAVFLPDGASLERTDKVVNKVVGAIKSNESNQFAVAFTGLDFLGGSFKNNAATIFVTQEHWDDRDQNVRDLVGEFFYKTGGISEAMVLAFPPPPISGLGQSGGFEVWIQNRGDGGPDAMNEVVQKFIQTANQDPRLKQVQTLWRADTPQLFVDVDRERAKSMGVNINEVFNTLAAGLGTFYVNDFNKFGRTWQVLMSADQQYRDSPEDIGNLYVRSNTGEMIPISALAKVEYSAGPETLSRFNNLSAVKLLGQGADGISSGDALLAVDEVMEKTLPADFSYDYSGASYQEKRADGSSTFALVLGALMVFLILAAQYGRWSLPFSVLLAMPFGIFGALLAVWLRDMTNDVYFQIGLVTLLGLAAKNAILIVEFAVIKREEGLSAIDAAMEASRLRFRPILMTSFAFILGVVPLAFSTGAGAGARTAVGTGVMGGMTAATVLAIFFVPLFYRLIDRDKPKGSASSQDSSKQGGSDV
ncbi:MAG: efflux RND transporter permease subunit [Limnobacter sp.]|nr:efflux RND transporter permease subunit [Limnobacter sp.]